MKRCQQKKYLLTNDKECTEAATIKQRDSRACFLVEAHLPRLPKFTLGKADCSGKLAHSVRLLAGVNAPFALLQRV